MKYLAAYLLLVQGGNESPSASDIKELLASVNIEADDSRISGLLSELEGKNVDELVAEGTTKLASVPTAGAAAGGAAPAAAGEEAAPAEEKEEAKEESDDDMGMGLFD